MHFTDITNVKLLAVNFLTAVAESYTVLQRIGVQFEF